jgi:hypothetical protein
MRSVRGAWRNYVHRNKLDAHAERNKELLRVFAEKQVNLGEPRSIDLHFWAWNQPSAIGLAHQLYKRGFMLLILMPAGLPDDPERWNIEAGTKASITSVIAEEFTVELIELAANFGAEYDGWGTSV